MSPETTAKVEAAKILPHELRTRIDAAIEERRKITEAQQAALESARANFEANPTSVRSSRLAIATLAAQNLTSRAERIVTELQATAEGYRRAAVLEVLNELREGITRKSINDQTEIRARRDSAARREVLNGMLDDEQWRVSLYQRRVDVEELCAELGEFTGNVETLEQIANLEMRLARVGNVMLREAVGLSGWSNPLIGRLIRETDRPG